MFALGLVAGATVGFALGALVISLFIVSKQNDERPAPVRSTPPDAPAFLEREVGEALHPSRVGLE